MAEQLASYFAGMSTGVLFAVGVYARVVVRSKQRRATTVLSTQAWVAQRVFPGPQRPQESHNGAGKVKVPECVCTSSGTSLSPRVEVTRVVTSCPVHGQRWQ